jgi:hypothetical protein
MAEYRRALFLTCLAFLGALFSACQSEPLDSKSIDDLPNPGRGWTTHSSFANDSVNQNYPKSTVAYFRFTWRLAEPTDGGFAFSEMDGLIAQAKSVGQRLAFRIEPDRGSGGLGIPDWLYAKSINGWLYTGTDGSQCVSPDAGDIVNSCG